MFNLIETEKICRIQDPLNWTIEKSELFLNACSEMADFHQKHCPEICELYKKHSFVPSSLKNTSSDKKTLSQFYSKSNINSFFNSPIENLISKIPHVGVTAMKYYLLNSLPESDAVLKLTSSGTRGQKTRIWFDEKSLARVQAMLEELWRQEGLISKKSTNYMMMVYDPEEAKDLGIAFTLRNQQRFAPADETFFAIKKGKNDSWEFDIQKAHAKLRSYIDIGKPVRILGITSFIYELVEELEKTGGIHLPSDSYMLTGGGWKAADDKKVPRDYFRQKASKALGIPVENIRDGYGMAEHSSPYIECAKHHFHVPVYNRIYIRNPITMAMLPPGETGLIELITPFNAIMPNLSVLSTDMGFIESEPCPCGWNSPTFVIAGRGGVSKHKGCALTAAEIVRRKV
ncbi:MAG: hypothetical protein HQM10_07615 [Candidatus Riflebacteria bacterium]|nr:hypothetical protein [Candidatus Riflebacteria bacterium]